jgi:hypothetical protein
VIDSRATPPVPTLLDYRFDGHAALCDLVRNSPYGTILQAVASLTLFSHPETVRQTGCRPVIRVIRNLAGRGQVAEREGVKVGLDDNKAPTDVFLWCNSILRRPSDVQFNHVYARSWDPESYACLANLCMTPSFLSKLTDTDVEVRAALQYRAWDLYGWRPSDEKPPLKPEGYAALSWAPCLEPIKDVKATFYLFAQKRPRDRTTLLAKAVGAFQAADARPAEIQTTEALPRDESSSFGA